MNSAAEWVVWCAMDPGARVRRVVEKNQTQHKAKQASRTSWHDT